MKKKTILKSLQDAEKFITKFEDDQKQKSIKKLLKSIRTSIKEMQDVDSHPISILSINIKKVPESLIDTLQKFELAEYLDRSENMPEDLYSCEVRVNAEEKGIEWSYAEEKYLLHIEELMQEQDCSYFRFII